MKARKIPAEQRLYILIHADDFAIGQSMFRSDHDQLRQSIRRRCFLNVSKQIPIVFTELDSPNPPLPDYLRDFDDDIIRVANDGNGNLRGQIERLRSVLIRQKQRSHYTFAGGWRDACLRYTVNQIAQRTPRFRVNEESMVDVHEAVLRVAGYKDRAITVDVDWPNVF